MNQHTTEIIMYAVQVYGYLMPKGKPFTLGELAQSIRVTYDLAEARTVEVLNILEAVPNRIASLI